MPLVVRDGSFVAAGEVRWVSEKPNEAREPYAIPLHISSSLRDGNKVIVIVRLVKGRRVLECAAFPEASHSQGSDLRHACF